MRFFWRLLILCLCFGCQSPRSGIADSCYQPLYWPSKACPPGKK